jgi:hypothetical protein
LRSSYKCRTNQQFAANIVISGATFFERNHPMTISIGTAYGITSRQIEQFCVAAALRSWPPDIDDVPKVSATKKVPSRGR